MRLLLRTTALVFSIALLSGIPSQATPIKPDLKKLLSQPQPKKPDYIPARAGWEGPEQRSPENSLYIQHFGPEASTREMRASLLSAALPDWRVVLGLVSLIFLLRRLRKASPEQVPASQLEPPADVPRAA